MRIGDLLRYLVATCCLLGGQQAWGSGREYLVAQDVLAIRSAPASDAPVVAQLRRGDMVVEFARRADWMKISVYRTVGKEGWVLRAAVVAATPPATARPTRQQEATPESIIPLTLNISGSPAHKFRIACRVTNVQDEVESINFEGLTPSTYNIARGAASCRVSKRDARGRLRVSLSRGNVPIASAETAAAYNWVRVRSAGPWGNAGGWRGAVRTPIVRRGMGIQQSPPSGFTITVN